MKFHLPQILALVAATVGIATATKSDQWRSRSIYQVLTDRFARSDISTTAKCNVTEGDYCGGTYRGIIKKLDYIQDMGFTAIWISPITYNIPEKTKFGYAWHGYWQQDLYRLNDHFGSAEDLQALSLALHSRGMYLMVDVVTNHNGWNGSAKSIDYSSYNPFDDEKYYHDVCAIADYTNQSMVEDCWLGDATLPLPDLRTEDPTVSSMYNEWIEQLVSNYSIDGLRIDTVKYVDKPFWESFQDAAGIFTTGEVMSSNMTFTCDYQNYLSSVLNYPAYYAMISFLNSTSGSPMALYNAAQTFKNTCKDISVLTTFTENHDLPRFASQTTDMALAKNALALTILWDGIPIVYAGQEQHYSGYGDPDNREATWLSGYDTHSELYELTRAVNRVRNRAIALDSRYTSYNIWPIYNDTNILAFRKGFPGAQIISVFTNTGTKSHSKPVKLSSEHTGWKAGEQVVDVLDCTRHTVSREGDLSVKLHAGLPQVFFPLKAAQEGDSKLCKSVIPKDHDDSHGSSPTESGKDAGPTETGQSTARSVLHGKKKKAAAVAGVLAYGMLAT